MQEKSDLLIIDTPQFKPKYKNDVKYGYSKQDSQYKKNLRTLLYQSSSGYCMYCYSKILVDEKEFGHMEHGIEKGIEKDEILERCVLNIAIACPVCNDKFKKMGEKARIEYVKSLPEYEKLKEKKCDVSKCYSICDELIDLREKLLECPEGHILLQPLCDRYPVNISRKSTHELRIQYDLLRGVFIPNRENEENLSDCIIIMDHINMFHLNDFVYRSNEIYRFCRDYINKDVGLSKGHYDNYFVDLFIEQISDFSLDKITQICELVYLSGVMLRRI